MSGTNNAMVTQRKFLNEELEELLDIDPYQTLEELFTALDVDKFIGGKHLNALGMVQEADNWVPHELKKSDIEKRFNDKKKTVFCIGSSLAMENGFTTTILYAK
ncbi:hypothetical protein Trydic_g20291 [Trypoxylus dichotomus]